MATRRDTVRVALVGGPMYDPLYDAIPAFERGTGLRVDVVARLPHPELNVFVKHAFESGDPDLDLLSTHTKYAPSQAQWLAPLEAGFDEPDLLPRPAELSRIGGRLLQVPRNLDVRLLHYRRDLFEDERERAAFERAAGRPLRVPETWTELADVASFFTRPGLHGFLFPGRDSGLFGTFYELLVSAGGELFDGALLHPTALRTRGGDPGLHPTALRTRGGDPGLRPAFDSAAGVWAAGMIADLHHVRRITPSELPAWHYDEISAVFRAGHAAMVCDWPGSYHLYKDPATCEVWGRVGLASLPAGPAGLRAAYAGCHSFALSATARNAEGASALLRFLTSAEAQLGEARGGAIPCRASALARVREEAATDPTEARRWDLLAQAEHAMIIPPRFAVYPLCEDAIWQSIQRAMVGAWTPRDAVASAAADIQAMVGAQVTVES